jgi:tyrosinase
VGTGTPRPQAPAAPLRIRRSAGRLTNGQLRLLRQAFAAVMAIGDDRGYHSHAGIHGLPLPIGCDNAHGTPYFLPWHRAYLYFFERALRDQVPDVTLTWWNWTATFGGPRRRIPPAFTERQADGRPNPLYSGTVSPEALAQGRRQGMTVAARTGRRPGAPGALPLPTARELEEVLRLSDFLDFSAQLEGLHDRVHVWTGGHMGMIPFAAFDPIFWAHHTMVDRVWRLWQLRHSAARPPVAIMDEALPPFRMTVRQTLDVTALGYDYAVATSTIAVH